MWHHIDIHLAHQHKVILNLIIHKTHIGTSPYWWDLLMLLTDSVHYTSSTTSPSVVFYFFVTLPLYHKHYHKQTVNLYTSYNFSFQHTTSYHLLPMMLLIVSIPTCLPPYRLTSLHVNLPYVGSIFFIPGWYTSTVSLQYRLTSMKTQCQHKYDSVILGTW